MAEQQEAVEQVRPLAATQVKNLAAISALDHDLIREEILAFAKDQVAAKHREIDAGANPSQMREVEDEARKIITEYEDAVRRLTRTAEDWGLGLSMPGFGYHPSVTVTNTRVAQMKAQAKEEIERERDIALSDLRKSEIMARRTVLQSGVSAKAEEVLSSLPSAQSVMLAARAGRELSFQGDPENDLPLD